MKKVEQKPIEQENGKATCKRCGTELADTGKKHRFCANCARKRQDTVKTVLAGVSTIAVSLLPFVIKKK